MRRTSVSVRIPTDVLVLDQHFDIKLEPPYWYLRCWTCGLTWHVPWDVRLRTRDGTRELLAHVEACCPEGHPQLIA
jgi:hypothetical protein